MPDNPQTLADIALINDMNASDMGVSDVFNEAPMIARLAATEANNGNTHSYIKEVGAPTVGFRDVNTGRDRDKSQDQLVTVDLKLLDASFDVDKALAMIYKRGGVDGLMQREGERHLRAALRKAEEQFIYGVAAADDDGAGDAAGFQGLFDTLGTLAHDMVCDAGGGAANDRTSVIMLRTSDDQMDVMSVLGNGRSISVGEYYETIVTDATGKKYDAYAQAILGWLGLQVGGAKSIARLANVGDAKPLTDDLLSHLNEKFPEEKEPNLIIMNKKARGQLRRSRTATTTTGAEAPYPTEWNNVPIIQTGSISSNEQAVA